MSPGPTQLIIILVIVLLLFGAKKIPELAKGLGTGMREFRQGASGELDEDKSDKDDKNSDSGESKVDKETSAEPAGNDDVRSEDESSDEKANKTEQRS